MYKVESRQYSRTTNDILTAIGSEAAHNTQ